MRRFQVAFWVLLLGILPLCYSASPAVLLFGLDGASWRVMKPLIRLGRMPHTAELLQRGVYGDLRSLPILCSPNIWTSIATGKEPRKHGITFFVSKMPDGRSAPISSNLRKTKAIWNILSDVGYRVGSVGYWVTWPAEPINGVMVSDHFSYTRYNREGADIFREGQIHPPELLDELVPLIVNPDEVPEDNLLQYVTAEDAEVLSRAAGGNRLNEFRMTLAADTTYTRVALRLLAREQFDFFAFYLQGVDILSHYYWKYMDPDGLDIEQQENSSYRAGSSEVQVLGRVIPRYYSHVDRVMGEILQQVDLEQTALILVSDHGFMPSIRKGDISVSGEHHRQGVYLFCGGPLLSSGRGEELSVLNITPTILYLFDQAIGRDMDGVPATALFQPEFVAGHMLRFIDTYDTVEDRKSDRPIRSPVDSEIMDKLKSLGYL